jgi:hypothetical protein
LRSGYNPTEVLSTLQAWGHEGRLKYLLIEGIDCLLYHPGYRGTFLVMMNRIMAKFTQRFPSLERMKWFALLPVFLGLLDLSEDVGQISMTLAYDTFGRGSVENNVWWHMLVSLASCLNQLKWIVVRSGSIVLFTIVVAIAISYLLDLNKLKNDHRRP